MRGSLLEFLNAHLGLRNPKPTSAVSNPLSEITNPQCLKTPRRGQSAQSPDRFIVKKRLISRRFFSE
jgi:hypothetical protein